MLRQKHEYCIFEELLRKFPARMDLMRSSRERLEDNIIDRVRKRCKEK
jgi:hypothetical protein